MVEVVTKISAAENEAEELRKSARQRARQLRDDAVLAGKRLLESGERRADAQSAQILAAATAEAEAYLAQQAEGSKAACERLRDGARLHMDRAADFIVERIVGGL